MHLFIISPGCLLPWTKRGSLKLRPCEDNSEDYTNYFNIFEALARVSETTVGKRTGCISKCHRREYEARLVVMDRKDSTRDILSTWMYYASGRFEKKTYYYTYTASRFVDLL